MTTNRWRQDPLNLVSEPMSTLGEELAAMRVEQHDEEVKTRA
jgi:hypothetical protein